MATDTQASETPATTAHVAVGGGRPRATPAIENGDRLSRDEFERRYAEMPELKKAELIDGVVYLMASPVSAAFHGGPQADLLYWLSHYRTMSPGVQALDNSTVRLGPDTEPQPDALLRVLPSHGGRTTDDGDYVGGPPELLCEIAATSASYDLHQKKDAYRRCGVVEYLVWRTKDAAVDWFSLEGSEYRPLPAISDQIIESRVFPGLRLDAKALLTGNLRRVLEVLNHGLATDEHAAFVEKLRVAGESTPS